MAASILRLLEDETRERASQTTRVTGARERFSLDSMVDATEQYIWKSGIQIQKNQSPE